MLAYFFSKAVFKIIRSPKIRWNLSKAFPAIFFSPRMTWDEYLLFKKICRSKKVFLEYGSGGSTIYLLRKNKKIFSVESNPEFYSYMNSIPLVKKSLNKNLSYGLVDLGPTNKWGKPLSKENSDTWSDYYMNVWKSIDPVKDKVDVIFIDGRFRVCCCLYSLLKVVEYNWKDTVFIIHDFWRREKYHEVLEFLEEVKSSSNLASFKLKANLNVEQVIEKMPEYAFDFS